jgi:hypothetical protein
VVRWAGMSEDDRSADGAPRIAADQTLMGVAPPRLESSAQSPLRSPVLVRSGTSVADVEPVPLPHLALPSRPPLAAAADSDAAVQLAVTPDDAPSAAGQFERARRLLSGHPALWMLLAPALIAVSAVLVLHATARPRPQGAARAVATVSKAAPPNVPASRQATSADELAKLEARPPESLNARELAALADAHSEALRASAKALRSKAEANPALGKEPALQSELMRLADDARSSSDALAAMAALEAPIGADLLYEVWTRTPVRTDATDLARALVYSADVRPKASPALAVALDLRLAESCEQYKAILPKALKDGDRRSAHLLAKLNGKRGCGPKKSDDCYACLREPGDELKATINAVKSRRPPDFGAR